MDARNEFQLTEQQWLESADPAGLISHLVAIDRLRAREGDLAKERQLRLLGVACCRHIQHWSAHPIISATIDAAEKFADGEINPDNLYELREAIEKVGYPSDAQNLPDGRGGSPQLRLARAVSLIPRFDDGWVYYNHIWEVLYEIGVRYPETEEERANAEAVAAQLRDIFGNPFRPVIFNPAWRTSDVLALARSIYDERAFDRMPILADALQDAGCNNADILSHCRDTSLTHVRGCWVVDLVLQKE